MGSVPNIVAPAPGPPAQQEPKPDPKAAAAQATRKKRRRTAAGGANDDCFSCRKGSIKCGRERPYCAQCMHAGTQCGGYKTTLTWGVGVASRGKLRGLSCPVANKNADGSDVSPTEMEARRRRKSSMSKIKQEEATTPASPMNAIHPHMPIGSTASMTSQPQAQSYPPSSHSRPITIPLSQTGWKVPGYFDHAQTRPHGGTRHTSFSQHRPGPHQRIQTAFGPHWEGLTMPDSGGSVGSYPDSDFHSPMEYPQTPRSMSLLDHMPPPLHESYTDHSMAVGSMDSYSMHRGSVDHYTDPMSTSLESMSSASFSDQGGVLPSDMGSLDTALFSSGELSYDPFDAYASQVHEDEVKAERTGLSLVDTRFSNPFYHLSPRLQSLMDYYDHYVCPFLVTFDGPENPYRKHVLQLAGQNRGLQNAIAALATNNLRMRRKESRPTGFVSEIMEGFDGMETNDLNEPSPEESLYKQMSIDQLNMQLTDTRAAQDDSVLATLLVLCLFHVCDSGFSKFKTQLAGMQKLLSLRDPNVRSDFTEWIEMFFVWFDVMTSTVNDREVQIKGESLDMVDYSSNLGALEQFSGCDGRLFKLIARLGRLNLLAQGRPVRPSITVESTPRLSAMKERMPKDKKRMFGPDRSLAGLDFENIDGNGWGSSIIHSDDDIEQLIDEQLVAPDERREFWSEWHDMRARLQSWKMDLSTLPSPPPDGTADPEAGQRDLVHINESFRCSALLYTERLGHPILPSSNPQFQTLVARALYHITALPITSCVNKFLLWPLFIIGTECVREDHRNVIRARCVEVQKESGFYNNLSALEVLERVWREVGNNVEGSEGEEIKARWRDNEPGRRYGQAFRWRKAMNRAGGEYIVV